MGDSSNSTGNCQRSFCFELSPSSTLSRSADAPRFLTYGFDADAPRFLIYWLDSSRFLIYRFLTYWIDADAPKFLTYWFDADARILPFLNIYWSDADAPSKPRCLGGTQHFDMAIVWNGLLWNSFHFCNTVPIFLKSVCTSSTLYCIMLVSKLD